MTSPARHIAYRPSPQLNPPKPESHLHGTLSALLGTLVFVGAVAGLSWWDGRFVPASVTQYTVKSGDTEWSIAKHFDPNTDPRKVVDWIDEHNGLRNGLITPGQVLIVPEDGRG